MNKQILGQHLDDEAAMNLANLPPNPSIHDLIFIKYRKFIAVFIPLILIHVSSSSFCSYTCFFYILTRRL